MTLTYEQALAKVGATVPQHLVADAEVPVLTGMQAQGDLLIVPIDSTEASLGSVPAQGVQVVVGEATGNSHHLHPGFDSPGILFTRTADSGQQIAVLRVPQGQSAHLIHTDEHGANGIGPGLYAIHEKREMREQVSRVTD
jgi:hypothetical protein